MGGTMPYDRLRYRNGLNDRRMTGDPYLRTDERDRTIRVDYLQGEMNRMEQSYMGVYYEGQEDLIGNAVRATGAARDDVLAVLRWFFGLPEDGCPECVKQAERSAISQRCQRHQGYEWLSGQDTEVAD